MDNVLRHMPRDTAGDDAIDHTAPHSLEAERTVLGGCMHHPKTIPEVAQIIGPGDFYHPAHETVWRAITDLAGRNEPTDPLALAMELEKTGSLRTAGGSDYLHTLAGWAMPNPDYYAERVRDTADLRAEADLGRRIVQRATSPQAEPGGSVSFIEDFLTRRTERAHGRTGDPVDALLAEMLDTNALDSMPSLQPLVGDLLHLDTLARVIGPSGHMKSFVTIDFAGHVGTGMPYHGLPVHQGTVIYLVAEGAGGIRKRVRAWEQHYGLRMDGVLFLPRPVQAMDPEWLTLIEACKRRGPVLIVVDTQARVSVGVEENSAKELGLVVDRMEQLRAATGACVLLIHHTGHVGEHGRGSSSAKGALQSELHVSKKGDNASNIVVTMKTGKQKDDEEGADRQFALKVVNLRGEYKADGRPVTSVVLVSLDTVDKALVDGTPEFLAAQLDRAQVPVEWGVPRVRDALPRLGIAASKAKVEEAVKIRKQKRTNLVPGKPPRTTFNQPPHFEPGSSGEDEENPSSDIPPTHRGGSGEATSLTSLPAPPSREGGGREGTPLPNPEEHPNCVICLTPLDDPQRLANGFDTHHHCPTTD